MLHCLYNGCNNYNLQVLDRGQKYICEPSATHIHELINAGYNIYYTHVCTIHIIMYSINKKGKNDNDRHNIYSI